MVPLCHPIRAMLLAGGIVAKFQFWEELCNTLASLHPCCNDGLMVKALAKSGLDLIFALSIHHTWFEYTQNP